MRRARPRAKVRDLRTADAYAGARIIGRTAAIAYAAVRPLVKDPREIADAMSSFQGLLIASSLRVRSGVCGSSTTPRRRMPTRRRARWLAYEAVYWIAGGKAKEGGIESLRPFFPACAQGLFDRRRGRQIRGDAGAAMCRS